MSTIPVEVGRRRFLMGAAGLAAAPLVAGMAGCAAGARPAQPGPTAASGAGAGTNRAYRSVQCEELWTAPDHRALPECRRARGEVAQQRETRAVLSPL